MLAKKKTTHRTTIKKYMYNKNAPLCQKYAKIVEKSHSANQKRYTWSDILLYKKINCACHTEIHWALSCETFELNDLANDRIRSEIWREKNTRHSGWFCFLVRYVLLVVPFYKPTSCPLFLYFLILLLLWLQQLNRSINKLFVYYTCVHRRFML